MTRMQYATITPRPDMHHIPKGAPYFRIARPLRFRISHSAGFLGYLKEEDSFDI